MDSKDFEDIYYKCQKNPNLPDVKLGKFSAKNYRSLGVSATAHSVKSDNPDILKKWIAIKKIADHIINQNILTPKDTIIPAPQHTGRAEYTLEIAKIISEKTGCKIADVLGCVPRDTLYNLKKRNGSGSITDSGIYLLNNKFPKYNVWFLDNVVATGRTFNDARKLIPHIKPLIYSISPRLKVKMKNRKPYFIRESKEQKNYLEILKEMLPFETEWKYNDDAGDFLVDIKNPKRFVIQYADYGKHKDEFIVNRRITKGDSWTWSTRFFKTIPEAIDYLKARLNESNELIRDFKKIYNENKEVKYMDFKKIYEMARTVKNGTVIDRKNWLDEYEKEYAKNSLVRVLKSKGATNIEVFPSESHKPCAVSAFLGKFTFVYLYLLNDKYVLQVKDTQKVVEEWQGNSFDQLKRDIFEFESDFEDFAPTLN